MFGLLDRETGKVYTRHVPTRRKGDLQKIVREVVTPGTELNTHALKSHEGLDEYTHRVIVELSPKLRQKFRLKKFHKGEFESCRGHGGSSRASSKWVP